MQCSSGFQGLGASQTLCPNSPVCSGQTWLWAFDRRGLQQPIEFGDHARLRQRSLRQNTFWQLELPVRQRQQKDLTYLGSNRLKPRYQ